MLTKLVVSHNITIMDQVYEHQLIVTIVINHAAAYIMKV